MNNVFHSAVRIFGPAEEKVKQFLEYSLEKKVQESIVSLDGDKAVYKSTAE